MELNEYQDKALGTAVYPGQGSVKGLEYCLFGALGELGEIANKYKKQVPSVLKDRPLLDFAVSNSLEDLKKALFEEELSEREKDREYWNPLKEDLEKMRRGILR